MLIDFHFHLTHDAFNIGLVMLEVNFTLCGFSNRISEIRMVLLGHGLKLMLFTVLCPGSLTHPIVAVSILYCRTVRAPT